jgi:hypothetical protein
VIGRINWKSNEKATWSGILSGCVAPSIVPGNGRGTTLREVFGSGELAEWVDFDAPIAIRPMAKAKRAGSTILFMGQPPHFEKPISPILSHAKTETCVSFTKLIRLVIDLNAIAHDR